MVAAVATLLLGGFGLFVYARAQRREPIASPIIPPTTPPDDAAPALAAKLTQHAQGFMGTLFDLLSAIFKPGETTVDMAAIPTRLASKHKLLNAPLEQELIDRGWLDPDRKRPRRSLGVTGFLLLLGSMGLFLLGMLGIGAGLAADVDQTPVWAARGPSIFNALVAHRCRCGFMPCPEAMD